MRVQLLSSFAAVSLQLVSLEAVAQSSGLSDRIYIVQAGDTLSSVAERLRVPAPELAARNYLQRPFALRIGRRLRLPAGVPREVWRTLPHRDGRPGESTAAAPAAPTTVPDGQVRLRREGSSETISLPLRTLDPRGSRRLANFLRGEAAEGERQPAAVPLHPRLVFVLARIGAQFPGKTLRIQPNAHPGGTEPQGPTNNHARGTAADVRVDGVSLQALQDFCLTLDRVGCGHHRRSNYVHFDVRRERASWDDTGAILTLPNHRRQ